jgi:YgiT-type zinc finger domain-containing protein
MTEQCSFCGNRNLSATLTRYIHDQGGDMLIVEDVPCIECDYCGEQYFEISTLKKIEADHLALAAHHKQPSRVLRVAVEDFHAL